MVYWMENAAAINDDFEYCIVIHGVIPEAMPHVAYRRAGRPELASRKAIKCPYCVNVLTYVDRHTKVQVLRSPKNRTYTSKPGQLFKHCIVCKNEIGIIIA